MTFHQPYLHLSAINSPSAHLFIFDFKDRSSRLAVMQNVVGRSGGKPVINDTGSSHISHVTKTNLPVRGFDLPIATSIEMLKADRNMGYPEEHIDEIGPQTHREIAA